MFDIFRREFEAAYDEGGMFQLTMHPHVIGYRSRIWIIEELIRLAQSQPGRMVRDPRRRRQMGQGPRRLKPSPSMGRGRREPNAGALDAALTSDFPLP